MMSKTKNIKDLTDTLFAQGYILRVSYNGPEVILWLRDRDYLDNDVTYTLTSPTIDDIIKELQCMASFLERESIKYFISDKR